MACFRQWLLLLLALALSGTRLLASEQRDLAAANASFQVGLWSRAETEFAQFVQKHPGSANVPQAVLMEGQAAFQQGKFQQAASLLQAGQATAGVLGDQYAYWIGQSEYQNADYAAAADTFAGLAASYPRSPWLLNAIVNEADALAKNHQPAQVTSLLQAPEGAFQQAAKATPSDERVLNGQLLLAQALLSQNQPGAAAAVLQSADAFKAKPNLDWERLFLLGHAQLAAGKTDDALMLATNLIEAADRANNPDLRGQSVVELAGILEKAGRWTEAVSIYQSALTNNISDAWQRQAILKIAEISAAQTNYVGAENSLVDFMTRYTNSPALDSVLLAIGELHLKNYVARPSLTNNDLTEAQSSLDQFIDSYTNSAHLGKAYLDRGWCFWIEQNWSDSISDFKAATEHLAPSLDLAVAHYKLADAEFKMNDFTNAFANYQSVVEDFTNFPDVTKTIGAEALYQMLRVCVQLKDLSGADSTVARIVKNYPASSAAEGGALIDGVAWSDLGHPDKARAQFKLFEQTFPNSRELPEVELAIARTYEDELNWPMAISIYESWVNKFTNNKKYVDVKYALASANFKAGNDAKAFTLYTNFLAEFPSNADYTPVAQWWIGDYYAGQGDWPNAEKNYKLVFQYWPDSPLAYPAVLMAGRAAMGWQDYEDAKDYFGILIGITNCPPQYTNSPQDWLTLNARAWLNYGDVLMQEPSPDTNNPYANYDKAIEVLRGGVCQQYANSEQAALAWGEIGNCYMQLAGLLPQYYNDATNAYGQVIASPYAQIAERSQAQIGIGLALQKSAALDMTNQTALLQASLDNYLDVFFTKNRREGETADPFWVSQAGLDALPLMQTLGVGDLNKFIDQMEALFPEKKAYLEKKRLELSPSSGH